MDVREAHRQYGTVARQRRRQLPEAQPSPQRIALRLTAQQHNCAVGDALHAHRRRLQVGRLRVGSPPSRHGPAPHPCSMSTRIATPRVTLVGPVLMAWLVRLGGVGEP